MKRIVLMSLLLGCNAWGSADIERHIVVITASYNNKNFYKRNVDSVMNQNYTNYHVIYTDDCSVDGTYDLVKAYIEANDKQDLFTLIHNPERKGSPLANHYRAIHSCKDTDIIVILDGDDWFVDRNVLSYLNSVYADPNIWLTFGQFTQWPTGHRGWGEDIPAHVVKNNSFRTYTHAPCHLRTFYAGLFHKIKKDDLMYEGDFFRMTGDNALMLPMIEMARNGHFKFISKVLMVYNADNPISEHRVVEGLQQRIDKIIRSRKPYEAIESPFSEEVVYDSSTVTISFSLPR